MMDRNELKELYYITPICNVSSIIQHGILSYTRMGQLQHDSVAMPEIQRRRTSIFVSGGRPLHEYVNLYICARNPMLYKLRAKYNQICLLSVSTEVLDLGGVIITDSNASSSYARFAPAPHGLHMVDRDQTFAEDWTSSDQIDYWRRKAAKCAEILVPDFVSPKYIRFAYAATEEVKNKIQALGISLRIEIDSHMFFL